MSEFNFPGWKVIGADTIRDNPAGFLATKDRHKITLQREDAAPGLQVTEDRNVRYERWRLLWNGYTVSTARSLDRVLDRARQIMGKT
jgi:hypothetical protein